MEDWKSRCVIGSNADHLCIIRFNPFADRVIWSYFTDSNIANASFDITKARYYTRVDAKIVMRAAPKNFDYYTVDVPQAIIEDGLAKMDEKKLRDYTSAERNEIPLHTVLAEYFPDAFAALARHAKKANVKHNGPDAPMAWAREKSTDHLNKAVRHLTTPDNIDPDTGEIELVGALWRVAAALQLREEKRLIALDIRPLSGVVE